MPLGQRPASTAASCRYNASERDLKPPPKPILWLATRLHPAFRRAERQAAETFATRRWLGEIERWESEWKPGLTKTNLEFSDVELADLDDEGLAEHLTALHRHLLQSVQLHFRLHVSDMGPLGNLMVHLEQWGMHRDDTFRALVAASPATRGPTRQLRAIALALRDAGVDPAVVGSLDEIRAASRGGGVAARRLPPCTAGASPPATTSKTAA